MLVPRPILFVTSLFVLLLLPRDPLNAAPDAAGRSKRPNILFLFADDHAYQAISAYGSNRNQTPHIDRLAQEGMRFDRCYVTNSICGPCRAVVLTGKYSHLNGFFHNGNRFNGQQQTMPKLMQAAGYQTALIGKWHLVSDPTGFDYWHILIGQGPYYNPTMIKNGTKVQHTGYTTDLITDDALDWLKNQRDPEKPFLLMCQHKAPHRNWMPATRHLTLYDDRDLPEPPTLFDDYANRASPASKQEMTIARHMYEGHDLKLIPPTDPMSVPNGPDRSWQNQIRSLTPQQREPFLAAYAPKNEAFRNANLQGEELVRWKYQRYIKDYLRCITAVDENVGRLLDYLDESGLAENTMVIYSSDQGFYLGEHGWYDKRWMYEESLRTPLIVRWPGHISPGSQSGTIVSNLDFAETFLDLAGVAIPDDMQGRSLVPVLAGKTPDDWRKSFYYHYYEGPPAVHKVARHSGVTDGRHKLIHYYQSGEWELFDLKKDPYELKSVYGDPAYATIQSGLEAELARLRQELAVPDPDPPAAGG
ncbi:MAG: sulfatase [Pirellulales bacterium]|nr:sulfatase [Pirellulales bacterium]